MIYIDDFIKMQAHTQADIIPIIVEYYEYWLKDSAERLCLSIFHASMNAINSARLEYDVTDVNKSNGTEAVTCM